MQHAVYSGLERALRATGAAAPQGMTALTRPAASAADESSALLRALLYSATPGDLLAEKPKRKGK
jgi:hypothetical protein